MINLDESLKNLLLEYKDTDVDEVTGWDPVLHKKLEDLYKQHRDEFFISLKSFIWEFDYNSGIMDFLAECVIGSSDYESNAHKKMLLDIFDNHPDNNKRIVALDGMYSFKNDFLIELEDRYENEKSMNIRNKMGASIIYKICRRAGCTNTIGTCGQAYKGNIDRFNHFLDFNKGTDVENLKLIELLRDSKYIPNNTRSHLEYLSDKLKGDIHG